MKFLHFFKKKNVVKIEVTEREIKELKLLQKYDSRTPYDMLRHGMDTVFSELISSPNRDKNGHEICWDVLDEHAEIYKGELVIDELRKGDKHD